MVLRVEVKCINKSDRHNPHERIESVGGINPNGAPWKLKEEEAIVGIESGKWEFWTKGGGQEARVMIDTRLGRKYLKTTADGIRPDNLLALPECP